MITQTQCQHCGACDRGELVGICPLSVCPKGLMNGPCGGMEQGKCELDGKRPCVHVVIRQRMIERGVELPGIIPAKDYSQETGPGSISARYAKRGRLVPDKAVCDEVSNSGDTDE